MCGYREKNVEIGWRSHVNTVYCKRTYICAYKYRMYDKRLFWANKLLEYILYFK